MPNQPPQQNTDNSLAMLWGTVLAFSVGILVWYAFHDFIASMVLQLRLYEARCIAWFVPGAKRLVEQLQSLNANELRMADLTVISVAVGRYLRFPVSLVLLGFPVFIYMSRATLRFKHYYDMRFLVESEKKNWVQITPVAHLNLVNTDIHEGPWAMSLTPFQFAKKNSLLEFEPVVLAPTTAVTVLTENYTRAKLVRESAKHAFIVQLGDPWQDVASLALPTKALFAIFAARAARDRKAGDHLMAQIARSSAGLNYESDSSQTGNLNFAGVDRLLREYMQHPAVTRVVQKHAYVLSVMASMLVLARQDGVLASAEFLWLKPCDRKLWFMLNCVGRRTAYAEIAGPFAHWIAESALGYRLKTPMVDTAVDALEAALKEVRLPEDLDTMTKQDSA